MKKTVYEKGYRSQNGYYHDDIFKNFKKNMEKLERAEFFEKFGSILGHDDGMYNMLAVFHIDSVSLAYRFNPNCSGSSQSYVTLSLCGGRKRIKGLENVVIKALDEATTEARSKHYRS